MSCRSSRLPPSRARPDMPRTIRRSGLPRRQVPRPLTFQDVLGEIEPAHTACTPRRQSHRSVPAAPCDGAALGAEPDGQPRCAGEVRLVRRARSNPAAARPSPSTSRPPMSNPVAASPPAPADGVVAAPVGAEVAGALLMAAAGHLRTSRRTARVQHLRRTRAPGQRRRPPPRPGRAALPGGLNLLPDAAACGVGSGPRHATT